MPNYAPCRTAADEKSHLYASEEATRSLCGKPVGATDPAPSPGKPCPECAKRLLTRIFQLGGDGGITSIEVTVQ